MSDDQLIMMLARLDRTLAPSAPAAERIWRQLTESVPTPASDDPVPFVHIGPPPAQRSPANRRRRLVGAAAAVVVIAGGIVAIDSRDRSQPVATLARSDAPFHADVVARSADDGVDQTDARSAEERGVPLPVETGSAAVGQTVAFSVSYGGQGQWRIAWGAAADSSGGPGSYETWTPTERLVYRADSNTYEIHKRFPDGFAYLPRYVDLDSLVRDCDRSWNEPAPSPIAGREATRIHCARDANDLTDAASSTDFWVDAQTDLLLRQEEFLAGRSTRTTEVVGLDYAPSFVADTFSTQPPPGAKQPELSAGDKPLGDVLSVGLQPPTWTLPLLDGGTIAFDNLRGRPAALYLWASWCGPCEGPALLEFDAAASDRSDVQLVSVAGWDEEAAVRASADKHDLTVPVAVDGDGTGLFEPWGVQAVPAYVFLDASGAVAGLRSTPLAADELTRALDDLAAGRPLSVVAEPPPPPPCIEPVGVESVGGVDGLAGEIYFQVQFDPGFGTCSVPTGSYAIRPDGSALERVTDGTGFGPLAVSRDGEIVVESAAFDDKELIASEESDDLWLLRRSLRPVKQLVEGGSAPAWSNDARQLAFIRKDATGAIVEIGLVNGDGSNRRTLTSDLGRLAHVQVPLAWEAGDGALLVVVANGASPEVQRVALDGTWAPHPLSGIAGIAISPADGAIAAIHHEPGHPDDGRIVVFVADANADGAGRRFLTPPRSNSVPAFYELDWSPDGAWLVASGSTQPDDPYPSRQIYLIDLARGEIVELANLGTGPTW